MAKVRVKLNRSGVRALLRSTAMQDHLRRRAERIAAAAGEGFEVDSDIGANRARAAVHTATAAARLAEAKNRALTRSIDAGR